MFFDAKFFSITIIEKERKRGSEWREELTSSDIGFSGKMENILEIFMKNIPQYTNILFHHSLSNFTVSHSWNTFSLEENVIFFPHALERVYDTLWKTMAKSYDTNTPWSMGWREMRERQRNDDGETSKKVT